jgi:hypothetical protein
LAVLATRKWGFKLSMAIKITRLKAAKTDLDRNIPIPVEIMRNIHSEHESGLWMASTAR